MSIRAWSSCMIMILCCVRLVNGFDVKIKRIERPSTTDDLHPDSENGLRNELTKIDQISNINNILFLNTCPRWICHPSHHPSLIGRKEPHCIERVVSRDGNHCALEYMEKVECECLDFKRGDEYNLKWDLKCDNLSYESCKTDTTHISQMDERPHKVIMEVSQQCNGETVDKIITINICADPSMTPLSDIEASDHRWICVPKTGREPRSSITLCNGITIKWVDQPECKYREPENNNDTTPYSNHSRIEEFVLNVTGCGGEHYVKLKDVKETLKNLSRECKTTTTITTPTATTSATTTTDALPESSHQIITVSVSVAGVLAVITIISFIFKKFKNK